MNVETEIIDKLFLELSQFTKATTQKELMLMKRIRELEQRHPAPVPVSERLPGPEDCDAEGRCWMFGKIEKEWRLIKVKNPGVPQLKYCFSHWLPSYALPLPAEEVEP